MIGIGKSKLSDIIAFLEKVFCESIGVEYAYIRDPEKVKWIQNQLYKNKNQPQFEADQKKEILTKLNEAYLFETFLHKNFVGQKRFSLEGNETLIPA